MIVNPVPCNLYSKLVGPKLLFVLVLPLKEAKVEALRLRIPSWKSFFLKAQTRQIETGTRLQLVGSLPLDAPPAAVCLCTVLRCLARVRLMLVC